MAPNVFNPGDEPADHAEELLPFISRRSPVLGKRGMVACSQPLAAEVKAMSVPCCAICDIRMHFHHGGHAEAKGNDSSI
jgi:hypothetical protein